MSKLLLTGFLAFGLFSVPAWAGSRPNAERTAPQPPDRILSVQQRIWFERAIEHLLDESAHVAQAALPRR